MIQILVVLTGDVLYTIGGHQRGPGKWVLGVASTYGLVIDVVALLAAIVAIAAGGPNRRFGVIAIGLIALSFALLFI
jgi:hypothetical protein